MDVHLSKSPLMELQRLGQTVWLDDIHCGLTSELSKIMERDGVTGAKSNPFTLGRCLASSTQYDRIIAFLSRQHKTNQEIYESLLVRDVQHAADLLRPTFYNAGGRKGLISFDLSPYCLNSAEEIIAETQRLLGMINRDNVMVKVPATTAGVPAIEQLIADGVNVDAIWLSSVETYRQVAEAYIFGLEKLHRRGLDLSSVVSTASFSLSGIDHLANVALKKRLAEKLSDEERILLEAMQSRTAILTARVACMTSHEIFAGDRWKGLTVKGARTQQLLWADMNSTTPHDTFYVEELIGEESISCLSNSTLTAFRDHGKAGKTLGDNHRESWAALEKLKATGFPLTSLTESATAQSLISLEEEFDRILSKLSDKRNQTQTGSPSPDMI